MESILESAKSRLSSLLSWRTAFIVLALANFKVLPFVWHFRLIHRFLSQYQYPQRQKKTLEEHSQTDSIHPLFQPVSIFSHTPFLELDYNIHKSNSTYFADLDESRTALLTKIYGPGLAKAKNLEAEGHKGRLAIILGSVHANFHKEIGLYERYEIRTRVLGWDRKWIYLGSWFIRPGKNGQKEVVLASALAKYVVKKGRLTIPPERCLSSAKWLPPRPEGCVSGAGQTLNSSPKDIPQPQSASESTPSQQATPASEPELIAAPIPQAASELAAAAVENLEKVVQKADVAEASSEEKATPVTTSPLEQEHSKAWDWHRIEMERVHGLRLVENWASLDKEMLDEYTHI